MDSTNNQEIKMESGIVVSGVNKVFNLGKSNVQILFDVNVTIDLGDFVIIIGPSGSGKSTLMHTMLGLEPPSTGNVTYFDKSLYQGTDEDYRSDFRKKYIGMVYQQPHWVRSLTVVDNVAFPLMLLGSEKAQATEHALQMLDHVGMRQWADYIPTELSGGQQQRVSVARALVNNPYVIFADEPTGNLDYQSGQQVMQLLEQLNKEEEKTIIMVTHDLEYLSYAKTAIHIFDGRVEGVYKGNDKEKLLKTYRTKRGMNMTSTTGPQTTPNEQTKKEPEKPAQKNTTGSKIKAIPQQNASAPVDQPKPPTAASNSPTAATGPSDNIPQTQNPNNQPAQNSASNTTQQNVKKINLADRPKTQSVPVITTNQQPKKVNPFSRLKKALTRS